MATAQEILNTMEEVEEQNVIVIDSDLRTIRIPEEIKILGVESDDDVLRLHFKMPKMYGEFDLSTFALRVNYLNANGDGDVFAVQDAAANGDELEFSWLVGRTAAQYKGDVKFIVCAKKVKEGGIVEKEFNTTPATLPVLEGLETIERVAQENPDVIEAILLRLDKLEKNGGGAEPDATLTQSGKAADAKATGDALNELKEANVKQDNRLTALEQAGGIVTIEPADDDIPKIYFTGTTPTSKGQGDVQLFMRYVSKTARIEKPVTLKVQGDSSAGYPKKNFTMKVYEDNAYEEKEKIAFKGWPAMNKFVLKAHWMDHSHVRNVGTAKIWGKMVESRSDYASLPEELRTSANNGATDGFTCKVFVNGVYQGLYELIVPKDKLYGQDSDVATHSILNSELNNQATCAFSTTSPTISGNWSEELQDSMSVSISTSFANFIKFVAGATDEEFVANAETYFDVQSVIDFDILARVFCIVDNLCKNQIFFTYDGVKWYEGAWDLDGTLGNPPTVRGYFAYDTEFQTGYVAYKDYGMTNMLYERVETLFMDRFKARYAELRAGILSADNIIDVYERLTDTITTFDGLLEEDYASTTAGGAFTGIPYKMENTIQQIRNFVAARLPYMDEQIEAIEPPAEEIPCTGITLDPTTLTFTEAGTQMLTATVTPSNTTDAVEWSSDAVSVASVKNGIVTAKANGSATITATCGAYSATCEVVVSGLDIPSESGMIARFVGSEHGDVAGEWADTMGGAPMTINGATWADDVLVTDGTDDYLTLPLNGAKTVKLSVKVNSTKTGYVLDCRPTVAMWVIFKCVYADWIGTNADIYVDNVKGTQGAGNSEILPIGTEVTITVVFAGAVTGNVIIAKQASSNKEYCAMEISSVVIYDTAVIPTS